MTSLPYPCLILALAVSLSSSSSIGERGSELGVQIFQQVADPSQNLLVSPHGVASVLGLLFLGAHGDTRRQILAALRYDNSSPEKLLGDLHRSLDESGQGTTVTISNGLFAQEGFEMKGPFLSAVKSAFRCESRNLDFSYRVSAARTINVWIRDHTNGKISNLIRPDMLDGALTRLVAVNAIYFKGLWKTPFPHEATEMGNFTAADGTKHEVLMMSRLSDFNTALVDDSGLLYQVIELPYRGDSFSMLIAVPPVNVSLSAFLPHVGVAAVRSWAELLRLSRVHLTLPRFSVEAELDMKTPLLALGVTDIFDQHKADFRHICSEPLYVSKALQKVKIEVNEDGTEASVATASVILSRSSPLPVTIDRPFVFLIRHKSTGTLLFMGQITKP